ncbi:ATP-dependent helicase [Mycoplasma nasistruthionis]|uniref:DNA 3'-5' helicase n=1 Tax=Mycoplasma nasistruthionis TaxID=353852 RepID=A0A5B7XVX8_9MOLU|nr:UvrD-helicase domain-containing protein [Mycoplasma nasistruthionis]QCZ36615.1 ATP-dependent DNA helicase PcrA [Mycoplasma nasistruthionis]
MSIYRINLLEGLNEDQQEAVKYLDTPLRIIAGAGSGKTRVLTRKVAYLINELGIAPNHILALTFTNKAANEMKERILQYCAKKYEDALTISTFHSFCLSVLRKHSRAIGYRNNFLVIDEEDKKKVIEAIYQKLDYTTNDMDYKSIMEYISHAKNEGHKSAHDVADELNQKITDLVPSVYQEYLNQLTTSGTVDFDDLIGLTLLLFDTHPEIAEIYKNKFEYILIDEFQDTSAMQYRIIKHIIGKNTHLTIVGDPDQTIFNWRGADINLILDFEKEFPNAKTVILKHNYRSTQNILTAANLLISKNVNRVNKDAITNAEPGPEIEYNRAFSPEDEARWVIQKINELKKQKNQLKSMAILYRSNYYARPFEEALLEANINYKVFNSIRFFNRAEIKDTIAFLRTIVEGTDIPFLRIINVPSRGIGKVYLERITEGASKAETTILEYLIKNYKKLKVPEKVIVENIFPFLKLIVKAKKELISGQKIHKVLNTFLKEVGYYKHISNNNTQRGTAEENVKELLNSIQNWHEEHPEGTVQDYLNMVTLLSVSDEYDNSPNYVSMMTIHSAKGLEFDNIFIVGLSEGVLPSYRVLDPLSNSKSIVKKNKDTIEDERRLAYVAVTRAKNKLFLSDSRGKLFGTGKEKVPSRFLTEMGIDVKNSILNVANKFGNFDDDSRAENADIIIGDFITHVKFGDGEVLDATKEEISVRFVKDGSIRTLNKLHPAIKLLKTN